MNVQSPAPRKPGRVLFVGAVLAFTANAACATALGSFATSLGVFAALAALVAIKDWPVHIAADALPTAGAALIVAGGAAWFFRSRLAFRAGGQVASIAARRRRAVEVAALPVELPAEIDRDALLAEMRAHFVRLQDAWDRGDAKALDGLATPDMLAELRRERQVSTAASAAGRTEILSLTADLLGFESLAQDWLLSIEFSGLLREASAARPVPFRELWLLTRSKAQGDAWRLARHQLLF